MNSSTRKAVRQFVFSGILLLFCTIISACSTARATSPWARPMTAPSPPVHETLQPTAQEGTIWKAKSEMGELFINPKAKNIGDIVTIKIVETSSAKNQATTNTGRSSSVAGQVESFLNLENKYLDAGNNFNPFAKVGGGLENAFSGNGATTRSGDLSAYITAQVAEVLPNKNLMIIGTREVQINSEKQYITLSGVIRARDISPDNVILSTYIADAKITYSGAGIVNEKQKPGWMTRILDKTWPF
jgi:flagellar L-ring protein FlgH